MSQHPLVDLAADPEVRRAASVRKIAAELTGERLAADYERWLKLEDLNS